MKCPHCHRTWPAADLDIPGLSPTLVLDDHVRRFCAGEPRAAPAPRAEVRQPAAASSPARRIRSAARASPA
ncbi:MAG TPA: hypothetical protein VJ874_03050, partial [Candidatus Thermoplasmatota archaeon]|nr:hypothetical protein [Candidatus Thermoplasmatota archaeon]